MVTLTAIYMFYGTFCYMAFGDNISLIVTEMMPATWWASLLKILFCINLAFTYSIIIHPTN